MKFRPFYFSVPPAPPVLYQICWLCRGTGKASGERCALCVGRGRVLVEEITL